MFEALTRVRYQVQNLEQAREWYRKLLGIDPILNAPFAVAFVIGDSVLMLVPGPARSPGLDERTVAYWGVSDLDAARNRMLEMGATACGDTAQLRRHQVRSLADPFGNVIGVSERIAAARRAVEHQPSESASVTAYCRALSAHDEREGLRGPGYMAEIFLNERGGASLRDQASREWAITRAVLSGYQPYLVKQVEAAELLATPA